MNPIFSIHDIINVDSSLDQSVNEFTTQYGVTDVANMYQAAISVASQVKAICLPLVIVAFTFVFLAQMTKWVVGERELDLMRFGKFLLLLLCLVNYEEMLAQINGVIAYFANAVSPSLGNYGSGKSLTDKVYQLLAYNRSKQDYSLWTDGLSNILDWLVANCTHIIIIVSRAVIYCIREIYMMFLMAIGPVALLLSMFPFFDRTVNHWLKTYVSVGCWALTMGVLDRLLNAYLDRMLSSHDGQGLIVINIGIALMYLMVPYVTSKYIGGTHSQFMGRMAGMTTSVIGLGKRIGGGGGAVGEMLAGGAMEKAGEGAGKLGKSLGNFFSGKGNSKNDNSLSSPKPTGETSGSKQDAPLQRSRSTQIPTQQNYT